MSKADPAKCPHDDIVATLHINKFEDTGGYMAEFRIQCRNCGHPFQFLGLEAGVNLHGAAVDLDGQELRIAISPAGENPTPFDILQGKVHPKH